MKKLKKLLIMLFLCFIPFSLASCYDLGEYSDEKDYTDSFDVTLIDGSNSTSEYDLSEFYNENAINKYSCPIDCGEYKYIAFKAKKDIAVGDIAFYLYQESGSTKTLTMELYLVDSLPTQFYDNASDYDAIVEYIEKIKTDLTATLEVSDGDEPCTGFIARKSQTLESKRWDSIMFSEYNLTPSKRVPVSEGQYLLVKVTNNAGIHYDLADYTTPIALRNACYQHNHANVSFKLTAVLIEAVK